MHDIFGPDGELKRLLPGFAFRPQQLEMAEAVKTALEDGGFLFCEAPTGVGKTFAYLIPAIAGGLKTVVSTASKNLQDQIFYKDIPILKKLFPKPPKVVYMKGRSNYLCLHRLDVFQREPAFNFAEEMLLFEDIKEWLDITQTGDRAEIPDMPAESALWNELCSSTDTCRGRQCPYLQNCFIFLLKQRAAGADMLIVNHHLFFADLNLRSEFAQVIPRYEAVIFDEAHQVEDVATQFFGFSISKFRMWKLRGDIRRETPAEDKTLQLKLASRLEELKQLTEVYFRPWEGVGRRRLQAGEISDNSRANLSESLLQLSKSLRSIANEKASFISLAERAEKLAQDVDFISLAEDRSFVYWVDGTDTAGFLHASPLNVAERLQDGLYSNIKAGVFTSATLAAGGNMSYMRSRLGLDNNELVTEKILSSPFDWRQQSILFIPRETPPPNDPKFISQAVTIIETILQKTSGRAFILFTSYRNLEAAYEKLTGKLDYLLLKQGDGPSKYLLKRFVAESPAVLFATSSFWEGIDVKGQELSCVIIDKLPFASPEDPIVSGRIEFLERRGKTAFFDYQVPMAVLRLKQGLGRLIRSEDDRGIMAVLDNRLLFSRYGKIFLKSLPPAPIVTDIKQLDHFAI